jgi:hypothetical protein
LLSDGLLLAAKLVERRKYVWHDIIARISLIAYKRDVRAVSSPGFNEVKALCA